MDKHLYQKKVSPVVPCLFWGGALAVFSFTIFPSLSLAADEVYDLPIHSAPILPESTIIPPLHLGPYNEKVYSTAYQVFLMNGNVRDAYQVASTAVKKEPENISWRERLIQSALWSNHPEVALKQWKYFIDHQITPKKYIPLALKAAQQLGDYVTEASILQEQLKGAPHSRKLILAYSTALQNQGKPLEALNLLEKIPGAKKDPDYLLQMIGISIGLDDPEQALSYLYSLNVTGNQKIKPKMKEAELLYMKPQLSKAYQRYQSVATQKAVKHNIKFWNDYAAIALLTGHIRTVMSSYNHLLTINGINKNELFALISLEQQSAQTHKAFQTSKIGYRKFLDAGFAKQVLTLGSELKKWEEINQFLHQLPAPTLTILKSNRDFAPLIPEILVHSGQLAEAYSEWESILQRWPNQANLIKNYLWFLMDQHDFRQLKYILERWQPILMQNPDLFRIYVTALTSIGRYPTALTVALRHQPAILQNERALLDLTDLFEQNNLSFFAYYTRWRAFYYALMTRLKAKRNRKPSLDDELSLTELLRALAPADTAYQAILYLSPDLFKQSEIDNQILAWALEKRNYALASYIAQIHQLYHVYTPPWMLLTLAVLRNDKIVMDKLVTEVPQILPYRDRVMAAATAGNVRAAESYAYQGLKEHPKDSDMYDLFRDTMLKRANKWAGGTAWETYGAASGQRIETSGRFFITPSFSIAPYASNWFLHTTDTSQLATTPDNDLLAGIAARQYVNNGWWELDIAGRQNLENTLPVILKWKRDWLQKLSSKIILSYHTLAPESTSLLIGGMKNEVRLALNYTWDSYNTIDMEGALQEFMGQDKFYLGRGQSLRAHWQSKFRLNYPDWNINLYGAWFNFQQTSKPLSQSLLKLVPTNQISTTDASFFVPVSSVEGAVTIGLGQQYGITTEYGFGQPYEQKYTHDWKPFAEIGFSYNSVFRLGPVINAGISGSVLGRDILTFYAEYSSNQQQGSQQNYIIGIHYEQYF